MLQFASAQKSRYGIRLWQSLCLLVLPAMLLFSCSSREKVPDVSGIKVDLQTQRFDRDLVAIDTNNLTTGLAKLHEKYPQFLNFYLDTLMGFDIKGNYADTSMGIKQGLHAFLTQKDYRGVFDTVEKHYPNTDGINQSLTKGFQFMKYYFPNYQVPRVIYIVTGLNNWGAFTYNDDVLGIGLDMFLGDSYPFYRAVGLPEYMTSHLNREYIPVASFSAIYQGQHPFNMDNKTLLDLMIQRGKEQYFLHKILPYTPDSTLFGYTQAQVQWCHDNEAEIYNFFISQNLLYAKEFNKVMRYVNPGPNSTGMPAQSPGNIGSWLGLQIVNSYMRHNSKVTMPQLLGQDMDAESFLQQSEYKPK